MTGVSVSHPEHAAASDPGHIALIIADDGRSLNYGELTGSANRIARAFARRGLAQGETVAFLVPNGAQALILAWAAKNSGLRYVMVGTRLNDADTVYVVRDSAARLLVSTPEFAPRLARMAWGDSCPDILLTDAGSDLFPGLDGLAAAEPATPLPDRKRGGSMLYSSGTTGRPKGVAVKLHDVAPEQPPARHALLVKNYGLGSDSVYATAAPFYHAAPLRLSMSVQRAGGTVIAFSKFDAEGMLAAIERYRVTHGFFVPTMLRRMLDLPQSVRERYDVSSMRHAIHGASPCPADVKRAMIAWWGPVIDELYGGTESIGQTFISSTEWLQHPGSVGRPSGQVEVKIVDDAGRPLGPGATGRVMMRNPQKFAYHGAAAEGAGEAYDAEGYATLGDIGYLDEDGYLYLTDRQANMIITGGANVYPQEAELVLVTHPDVADVAVIGVAHRDLGEVAKALVVPADGARAGAELAAELLEFCADRISRYKCPRSLEFVADLPRNELGKLIKRQIPTALKERPGPFSA